MMEENTQQNYTLKILFGPMFGCELHLPADDYFLIINAGLALQDKTAVQTSSQEHAAYYTQNTLYIPYDKASPNIILRLSEYLNNEEETGIRVEVQDVNGSFNTTLKENEIFTYEHICFAYKRSEDEWTEDIKNFNYPTIVEPELTVDDKINIFNTKKRRAIIIGSILFLILLILAVVVWYKNAEYDRRVLTLNEVLAGAPAPLEIVKSRDNKSIYVLAHKLPEMEWAQEALYKIKDETHVVPIWLNKQRQNVIAHMSKAGYPVLQIDYTTPQHPVVAIYRQLSINEEATLKAAALKEIPFAQDIRTTVKSKDQLLKDARQGLDRLHIYYRQIDTTTGYALVVRDALSDTSLSALQKFIKGFHQQWGNSVITFSINLDENWLQNKSYVDSNNGYLFLNPRHWYFPIKHGDLN
ncbi:PrgH/EprH family type III secretion apparatus protein [Vagococcus sp. WN89Y]|uniref:PrgH/EprH family type III secretion apparatus protein n=1 Tax=Vagococcus sp. WN89Y TaxID=3457258 RepID=UPI003FCEE45E